jgi:RNA polymerase primary sigma factor
MTTALAARPRRSHRPRPAGSGSLSRTERREVERLLDEPIDYMDHKTFAAAGTQAELFDAERDVPRANTGWYSTIAIDGAITAADQSALRPKNLPLLTAEQERVLFFRYNYARRAAEMSRRALAASHGRLPVTKARSLLQWHRLARQLREQIAEYNLALVLAMAQRIRASHVEFQDLISEGNLALLRAIDKFDAGRGYKFSTYACRAMIKAFGRLGIKCTKHKTRFPVEFDPEFERSNHQEDKNAAHENDCAAEVRRIFDANLAMLSPVEREVIGHRFALGPGQAQPPLTLEQVGHMVGLTKERVRQIQKAALAKLRDALESNFLNGRPESQMTVGDLALAQ